MIQIIKMGEGCESYFKTLNCECCGTIFRATPSDLYSERYEGDYSEWEYDTVRCPICGNEVDFQKNERGR